MLTNLFCIALTILSVITLLSCLKPEWIAATTTSNLLKISSEKSKLPSDFISTSIPLKMVKSFNS